MKLLPRTRLLADQGDNKMIKNDKQNYMILYHSTTQRKAKKYHDTGFIKNPVRGFSTLKAAMFWSMKVGRKVIYEIEVSSAYKLPDHHNKFGEAWWYDGNVDIKNARCIVSAT